MPAVSKFMRRWRLCCQNFATSLVALFNQLWSAARLVAPIPEAPREAETAMPGRRREGPFLAVKHQLPEDFQFSRFHQDTIFFMPDFRPAKFDDSASRQTGLPQMPHATGLRDRSARPCHHSIPPARFRYSADLISATKAPLNSPPNALRTQRRSRRPGLAHRPTLCSTLIDHPVAVF